MVAFLNGVHVMSVQGGNNTDQACVINIASLLY